MNTAKWQIIKYLQVDGSSVFRCERKRSDMNIIDSATYRNLSEANERCKLLNETLARATSHLSKKEISRSQEAADYGLNNPWLVTTTTIEDRQMHICYRLGEKTSDGRIKGVFDSMIFANKFDVEARCRELNAPLLPKVAKRPDVHPQSCK